MDGEGRVKRRQEDVTAKASRALLYSGITGNSVCFLSSLNEDKIIFIIIFENYRMSGPFTKRYQWPVCRCKSH